MSGRKTLSPSRMHWLKRRSCRQAVTNGTSALISLDTEVPGQPSVTALLLARTRRPCDWPGWPTDKPRRPVPIEVRAPRNQARLQRPLCLWGLPNLASMCWSENIADKRGTRPAMPPWSLRIRVWHDNKLDDDTALGAFERKPCIACGKVTSPCQLCPHVPPLRSRRLHPPICEA